MKLLSLFSGIGAFEKALDNLGIEYELVNYCEIDKYASLSYSLIHNVSESKNLGDITKVDTSKFPKDIDLVTYGFPCQDISLAGKQQGFQKDDGSTTRSGLFFEALRIIEDTKPRIAIAENVKNLVSKKFSKEFNIVLSSLDKAGYNSYFEVLNSKDFGIPQNRERVFIVSIRKDIDKFNFFEPFMFPRKQELKLRLKDLLESQVDEKYFLSDKMISFFHQNSQNQKEKGNGFTFAPSNGETIAKTITTRNGSRMDDNFISIPEKTKKGYALATDGDGVYVNRPHQKRGVVQKGMIQTIKANPDVGVVVKAKDKKSYVFQKYENFYDKNNYIPEKFNPYNEKEIEDICPTLSAQCGSTTSSATVLIKDKDGNEIPLYKDTKQLIETIQNCELEQGKALNLDLYNQASYEESQTLTLPHHNTQRLFDGLRIRKLTPKECFRLMGFSDDDFEKVNGKVSDTQLYKQAGNSIVVNVLMALFKRLQDEGLI